MSTLNQSETEKNCKYGPGIMVPLINKSKCEAKDKCTAVCPYNVFELRNLTSEDKVGLSFFVKFKIKAHGDKQAFATNSKDCHACSDCIKACPEHAITLIRVATSVD